MKHYAVAEINITHPGWIPTYVEHTTKLVEQHGGRYLARTPNAERIEGERPLAQIHLIIEWPSKEAAQTFYNSDEYKPHLTSRKNGSTGEFVPIAGEDITGVARMDSDHQLLRAVPDRLRRLRARARVALPHRGGLEPRPSTHPLRAPGAWEPFATATRTPI